MYGPEVTKQLVECTKRQLNPLHSCDFQLSLSTSVRHNIKFFVTRSTPSVYGDHHYYHMSTVTVRPPLLSYQGQCAAICGEENLEAL